MRIAICDDEKSMGQILEEKVKKLLPDAVVEKYLSGDDLISSGFKPDILFMDIQMPGKDGMETARIVRQNNKDMILIFVTAVEEYVFQAFDVGAFHYLVKPFSDDKFEEVVKRAIKTIGENSYNENDDKYMMIQSAGSHIKVFCVILCMRRYSIERLLFTHEMLILSIMENYRIYVIWQERISFGHIEHILSILNML